MKLKKKHNSLTKKKKKTQFSFLTFVHLLQSSEKNQYFQETYKHMDQIYLLMI